MRAEVVDRVQVATKGEPAVAVAKVLLKWQLEDGGIYRTDIAHDGGCPCVAKNEPLTSCTCEIVRLEKRRLW